jgi:hypothetical protein
LPSASVEAEERKRRISQWRIGKRWSWQRRRMPLEKRRERMLENQSVWKEKETENESEDGNESKSKWLRWLSWDEWLFVEAGDSERKAFLKERQRRRRRRRRQRQRRRRWRRR